MGVYIIHPLVIRVIEHFVVIDSLGTSIIYWASVLIISAISVFIMKNISFIKKLVEL